MRLVPGTGSGAERAQARKRAGNLCRAPRASRVRYSQYTGLSFKTLSHASEAVAHLPSTQALAV